MNNSKNIKYYLEKYNLKDPWDIVDLFEKKTSSYLGSKYAVSVDCCTHGIFLCLKYLNTKDVISLPENTYISIPNVINMAGYKFEFKQLEWDGDYKLNPLAIVDSACKFTKNMYKKNTLTCLSFHHRKHLPIGRGGMVLTDDLKIYEWLKMARYDGRHLDRKYDEDNFEMIGYHMYLTPEQACIGLEKIEDFDDKNTSIGSSKTYKSLSKYIKLFNQE
jgi:dTDP-4-amino-4,6-dideoxygalactose transaminase